MSNLYHVNFGFFYEIGAKDETQARDTAADMIKDWVDEYPHFIQVTYKGTDTLFNDDEE